MNSKQNSSGLFSWYSIFLFLLIFTYLVIRSIFNEPLHDEVATFFNYIEGGRIFGEGVIQDAQNHLLNTYSARLMYLIFGDDFFFLRLPNLIAFVLYFVGIYQLCRCLVNVKHQILLLTALSTVSFMTEYFAYSRGYGMGISFLIWIIIYTREYLKEQSLRNALLVYVFAYLSLFSNLIFLGSALLAVLLILLFHAMNFSNLTFKQNLKFIVLHVGFMLSIVPFLWFAYVLKMGGALYYGSLKGFWEVTGKSLSKNVLFYDEDWLKYFILLCLFFFLVLLFRLFKKMFWKQIIEVESIVAYYFFGNVFAIFLLANLFKVNYPEDRVGMYLIPLFILLFTFLISKFKQTKIFIFMLVFFPISFVLKMSIHSSIFLPEDRMTDIFYSKIRKQVTPEVNLGIYPVGALTWALHERSQEGLKINATVSSEISPLFDVYISKVSKINRVGRCRNMDIIAADTVNGLVAFRRKLQLSRREYVSIHIPKIVSSKKHIQLMLPINLSRMTSKSLEIEVRGKIHANKSFEVLKGEVLIDEGKTKTFLLSNLNHRWLEGCNRLKYPFAESFTIDRLKPTDKKLCVNIWNPEGRIITFKSGSIKIYEIESDYGIR